MFDRASQRKAPAPQGDDLKLDTPVTTVIRQRPRPDAVDRYENWLKEIIPVAQQFAGHRSVNVIRPHGASGEYTIVLHFDTTANLRKWLDSDARATHRPDPPIPQHGGKDRHQTGLEFWFTPPPGGKPARPYKQFFVTLSAIFPLTILVPWLLQPAFAALPPLALPGVRHFVIAAAIVAIMIYGVMPRYTRLVSGWLYS